MMAYVVQVPARTYVTLDKSFQITQERQSTNGKFATRFNVSAPAVKLSTSTEWLNYPLDNMVREIMHVAPSIEGHLPLIETTDDNSDHGFLCASFLLRNGELYHLYRPKQEAIEILQNLLQHHHKIWLSDDNHYAMIDSRDIAAVVLE